MEYNGLIQRYPVDRPLTGEERSLQLHQPAATGIDPLDRLSVIRMNSTFLETVDKYYAWRGALVTVTVPTAMAVAGFFVALFLFGRAGDDTPPVWFLVTIALIPLPLLALLVWLFFKDAFLRTHFPTRFNRRTRMVHAMRLDGSVLSVAWDAVFFCLARCTTPSQWDVRGHVLDADGITVRETFSLGDWDFGASAHRTLRGHWEFVRRYMEGETGSVDGCVRFCLPIAERREPVRFGFHRMFAEAAGHSLPMRWLGAALAALILPGRWLAMRTSSIPTWPDEIERVCRVDGDDPFVKDSRVNPPDLR